MIPTEAILHRQDLWREDDEAPVVPEGKVMGCLPRQSRIGDVSPLFADEFPVIPRDKWGDYIGRVTLRQHVTRIKDQDGVGSCATESTTQSVEIARSMQGMEFVELNPWSIYRITSGGRDGGSSIDTNLQFVRDVGILPEDYWPRSKGWRQTPPDGWREVAAKYRILEFYDITSILQIGSALLMGFPVVFGWSGHSCVMVDLLDENTARYANSWGNWGDEGFGKIKLSSVNWGYGAFATRVALSTDPAPVPGA